MRFFFKSGSKLSDYTYENTDNIIGSPIAFYYAVFLFREGAAGRSSVNYLRYLVAEVCVFLVPTR